MSGLIGLALGWLKGKGRPLLIAAALALAVGLAGGYALGRRPARESEKTAAMATATADSITSSRTEEKRTTFRRAVVERFDPSTGIVIERRTERERELSGVTAAVESAAHLVAEAAITTERVVERDRASLRLRLDAGWSRLAPRPDVWGGAAELRVLGPVWLGAGYGTDRVARLSVALEL
jgi:hypothetical protein